MAKKVGEEQWTAIKVMRKAHPEWTMEELGKAVGLSDDVAGRVCRTVSFSEYKELVKTLNVKKKTSEVPPLEFADLSKPITDKEIIEICDRTVKALIDAPRVTTNRGMYDRVNSEAVEDSICLIQSYKEMLEAIREINRGKRVKQLVKMVEQETLEKEG